MHIGFIKLSDGMTAIADEEGIIKKANDISSEKLLIENKLESINTNINKIKNRLENYKAIKFLSKMMLIS